MDTLSVISYVIVNILLPTALIVVLIYLAIILKNSGAVVKKFDGIADDLEHKLKLLNAPFEAIVSIGEKAHKVGDFFHSIKKALEKIPSNFGKKGDK